MAGGNDYLIQVKGNQKGLQNKIKSIVQEKTPLDCHIYKENNRARSITRTTKIYDVSHQFDSCWVNLHTIVYQNRNGTRNGKYFNEDCYYISSLKINTAAYYAEGIRSHWGIENNLHWVKDKIMNEDNCRIKSTALVANLSLFRSVVLSLFQVNNWSSITKAIEQFNNRLAESFSLINNSYILKT